MGVKSFLEQELLQPLVKNMPLALGQLIIRKPHAALPFLAPAKTRNALFENIFKPLCLGGKVFQRIVEGIDSINDMSTNNGQDHIDIPSP